MESNPIRTTRDAIIVITGLLELHGKKHKEHEKHIDHIIANQMLITGIIEDFTERITKLEGGDT